MTEHALGAPSAMHRIVPCPGSVMLQQAYPQEEGEEAKAGTAAHWVAFSMWQGMVVGAGVAAPNGVIVTDEMIEAAEVYLDAIRAVIKANPGINTADVALERRVAIPRIHKQHAWGTPDARLWRPGFILHLFDFKFGHRIVEAYENWQLMAYAAGCLDEPHVADWVRQRGDENITLSLTVVQPRAPHPDGPVRTWTCKASDIRAHVNRMQMATDAALSADPPTSAGPWCRDCAARHACITAQRAGMRIVDEVMSAQAFDPTPEQLGLELRLLRRAQEVLDARVSGLEEQASAMLKTGQSVPFWRIASVPGREKWTVKPEEVVALGHALQIELGKVDTVTPNQARQLGIPAEVVAAVSARPNSALKLTPDDGSVARRVFGGST